MHYVNVRQKLSGVRNWLHRWRVRMNLSDVMGTTLLKELHTHYQPILDDLMQLESDYPHVARNQGVLSESDTEVVGNTQASLLYSMQGNLPTESRRTRREIRDALDRLQHLPGIRAMVALHLIQSFSATIYMVEHLFFLNRGIERRLMVTPRAAELQELTLETAVYPMARVNAIVERTYTIWEAACVL